MSRTVLILSSSPRTGGNSDLLCDSLASGVEAAGNKVLGIFGEEAVNVLGVNLAIAQELGLIGEVSK